MPIRTDHPRCLRVLRLFRPSLGSSRQRFRQPQPPNALQDRPGAVLAAYAAGDGAKLAEYPLKHLPVFDGLAVAGGRLYLAMQDGRLLCLGAGG